MQNCPRSCPSRELPESSVRTIDSNDDSLPESVLQNILLWKQSTERPLKMREYDVASYDSPSFRFQEYQKIIYDFRYQLNNGKQYIK